MHTLITHDDWLKCQIKPGSEATIKSWIHLIELNRSRYDLVSAKTKLPYWLIGAIHGREASFNFKSCLHNGDPLNHVTTHVPAGRGPFHTWEESAIDAITMLKPDRYDYSKIEDCLNFALDYNGHGYEKRGLRSPYVWGLTSLQTPGLFVADHKFDPNKVSTRPGVASIAKFLFQEVTQK